MLSLTGQEHVKVYSLTYKHNYESFLVAWQPPVLNSPPSSLSFTVCRSLVHNLTCHDVVRKWLLFQDIYHLVQATTRSMLGTCDSYHPLPRHVVSYLVPSFLLFWALCAHAQLNPSYSLFYLDVTHIHEIVYQALPTFPYFN